jgi:hypothetical protein
MTFLDKNSLPSDVGSAWYRHLRRGDAHKQEAMVHAAQNHNLGNGLNELVKDLSFASDPKRHNINVVVDLTKQTTKTIGGKIYYGYPIPESLSPVAVAGSPDFVFADHTLYIPESFGERYPDLYFIIMEAKEERSSVYTYTADTETAYEHIEFIVDYFKNKMDKTGFKQALYTIARLPRIDKERELLKFEYLSGPGARYHFDNGYTLDIPYEHDLLRVGTRYDKRHMFLGAPLSFNHKTGSVNWYKEVNWAMGLSLEKISIFKNLVVAPFDVYAYAGGMDYGSWMGDKVHARFQLIGDFDVQEEFWDDVAERETLSGQYLNSVIGLPNESPGLTYRNLKIATPPQLTPNVISLPGAKLVNGIDIIMKYFLNDTAFVININSDMVETKDEILRFIEKHAPIGVVPIPRVEKEIDGKLVNIDAVLESRYNKIKYLKLT